ncbi:hypothetical protein KI387_016518 [Taxus chinensis]|uniref:Cytochrome P450 n=1 Tax=Taxus chinensis TaxID=29808 RepID=A0AA38GEV6_TAXCH|nr:hypothetical protein KI387_016518 [Taxus chinensis]
MEQIIDQHIERRKNGNNLEYEDFLDVLLSLSEDEFMQIRITRGHIKNVTYDLLAAATDTSWGTLEWAMSELLRNPSVMKKAQEELDSFVGMNRLMTQILVNAWAIGRDPSAWEEATEFKPERFMGSQIDIKGQSFEMIPFGSGRRGCPGIGLAMLMVQLGLAQLLHCFDWSLPHKLDMSEAYGITLPRAVHLHAIPIPRLPLHLYQPKAP